MGLWRPDANGVDPIGSPKGDGVCFRQARRGTLMGGSALALVTIGLCGASRVALDMGLEMEAGIS